MSDAADRLYLRVLVLRCQTGDEAAFAEMVGRYQGRLRYYLRKLLQNADAADDVLQEVWCDVFRALPRLAEAGAFEAWLYRIARDRAFRTFRRRQLPRADLPADDLAGAPVVEQEFDLDADAFTAEDAAELHAALDGLGPEEREVLVLRFMEDLSYDEIAQITGCKPGTVKSRLHYAKRALRSALERTPQHE